MLNWLLNLPEGTRKVIFAVVAVLIVGVGYVAMTSTHPTGHHATTNTAPPAAPVTVPSQAPNAASTDGAPQNATTITDPTKGVQVDLTAPVSSDELRTAAGTAIRFSEMFLSYRYDQNNAAKQHALNQVLAKNNTVDLTQSLPSGPLAASQQAIKTVSNTKVTAVHEAMVSPGMVGFDISATTTTTTTTSGTAKASNKFAVTMSYDADRGGWFVTEYVAATGPLQNANLDGN